MDEDEMEQRGGSRVPSEGPGAATARSAAADDARPAPSGHGGGGPAGRFRPSGPSEAEPAPRESPGRHGPAGEPLRVLLVANTLPPADVSGVGEQVLQLAAGLRQAGCEVEILGRRTPAGEPVPPGVLRDGAAGRKVLFPLTVVPAAWRTLRHFRPHVVQVHESDGALAALLVRLLRPFLRPRPKLVALLQVSYVEERRAVRPLVAPDGRVLGRPGKVELRFRRGKGVLQVLLGRLTARLAHRVLAPSERTAQEVRRDYPITVPVGVLPNVTGGLAIVPEPVPDDVAALAEGAFLFVGRLRIRKGVEVLLEALAATPSRPDLRLLIAGDGEHRAALESRAAELALGDRVRFLGRCTAGQVRTLLARCRALVVPSTYEGMPLVILEAMDSAVPIVATAVSGIPEVVVDGETGWLVPPEDPEALARALQSASEATESHRRGHAARHRVESHYRPAHAAARWLELLDR